jgi:ribulose-5-phosphate 4-epimerase/fuculose-1-phosphate aldolase
MNPHETKHLEFRKKIAPRPGRYALTPPLTPQAELALLCRLLYREGYDDHIAGHITYRQPDGMFLANPWELAWDEVRPEDVIRLSATGEVIQGAWNSTPALDVHHAVHRHRSDISVVIHNHPRYGTLWAIAQQAPAIFDQTSAQVDGPLPVLKYEGTVDGENAADAVGRALGDAKWALLANHGVLVTGCDIRQAHLRAITLEWRCHQAWEMLKTGQGVAIDPAFAESFGKLVDERRFPFLFEAMVRRELRRDPQLAASLEASIESTAH